MATFITIPPKRLSWTHVDDVNEWYVAPIVVVSPLRMRCYVGDAEIDGPLGSILRRKVVDASILDWHAEIAFAFVSPKTRQRLFDELGLSVDHIGKLGKENEDGARALALVLRQRP